MNKYIKICLPIVIIIAMIIYMIHWAFFDIQRIKGQESIREIYSPDGKYTIIVYLNNGGATTDYATLCSVRDNKTGKERNIYWQYHCEDAQVQWKDERVAVINGVELDVMKDAYDYRND